MHHKQLCYNIENMQGKKAPFLMSPQVIMQQKLQKNHKKKTVKMAPNSVSLGLHQSLMEQKNTSILSITILSLYREDLGQKVSIFNIYFIDYGNKNCKKIVQNCENGPKQSIFTSPLGTNGMEKYLNCIINSCIIIQEICSAKRLPFQSHLR